MNTAPDLWREAKAAMDGAARAYLSGASDAVERAERALALMRQAEAKVGQSTATGGAR